MKYSISNSVVMFCKETNILSGQLPRLLVAATKVQRLHFQNIILVCSLWMSFWFVLDLNKLG